MMELTSQKEPGGARRSQEGPEETRGIKEELEAARRSQEESGGPGGELIFKYKISLL